MCKNQFSEYVIKHNLIKYTPTTYTSIKQIPLNKQLIVKPFSLNSGTGMFITSDLNKLDFSKYVIQEYLVNNTEYCAYIVAKEGKVQLCIIYETVFNTSTYIKIASNPNARKRKVTLAQRYIDQLELFLLPCSYTGVCNIDFKICDDLVKVFEINPRLGGSLMTPSNKKDLIDVIKSLIEVFHKNYL